VPVRLLVAALLFIGASLHAQPGASELRGRLLSETDSTPVKGARVELLRPGTLASVARALGADDGTWRLRAAPGRYRLRMVAIGFAPRELPSVELRADGVTDVGTIRLTVRTPVLQQVKVEGTQDLVALAPDRNQYVVKDMPAVKGGNALDVLRNVPSVDVDIDNVVSLRGNSGVTVQINGRPSPLKGQQLGDFLATLSADLVERIEVIPNPSAKDDPDGSAGIINIVLKRTPDAGTSGGATVSGATNANFTGGGSLGWQKGPWTAFGGLSGFRNNQPRVDVIHRDNLFTSPTTFLDETGDRTTIQHGATLIGRTGYQLSNRDELTFDGLFTRRVEFEVDSNVYRNLAANRTLATATDRVTTNNNHRYNLDLTSGWRHTFAQKGHKLSVDARLYRSDEEGPLDIVAHTLASDLSRVALSASERQYGLQAPADNFIKTDWVRPLTPWLRLDAGLKTQRQGWETRQDTRVQQLPSDVFRPDSARISNFTASLVTHSVYGVLNAQRGQWLMQAGLRLEQASTAFHQRTVDSTYHTHYRSAFPSALIAYNVTSRDQLKLSFSERIRRPDPGFQIDPSLTYTDPLNISRGNPNLKPEYTRAFELGYQRSANGYTLQLTPFFRRTTDAIRQIRTIDTLGVSTRTYANVSTTDAYGIDGTIGHTEGAFTGFLGASGFRQVSDAANLGAGFSAAAFVWTGRANLAWRVSRTVDVQALTTWRAAQVVEQGRNGAQIRPSVAIRQKLLADRLALTLRALDPFNTNLDRSVTIDPRFTQVSDRTRVIRALQLTANWTFGSRRKQHEELPEDRS
jgi:outer membrane receptor protein involved in Fe transport